MSEADEDRFLGVVWSLETLGLEVIESTDGHSEYLTYFSKPPLPREIEAMVGGARGGSSELLATDSIVTDDWQSEYRRRSRPFPLAARWWVDPGEPDGRSLDPPRGRTPLRIPARTAFGTGSHLSTSLIVELMEGVRLSGSRLLDIGTGSGILAIVALLSGAASVTALDIDPLAACIARQTCRLNGVEPHLFAGSIAALRRFQPPRFDVIVANVLPANLTADLPAVVDQLSSGGSLLLSGLLIEQGERVEARLRALGLQSVSRRSAGEWLALQFARGEA